MRTLLTLLLTAFFLFEINGQPSSSTPFFKMKPAREAVILASGTYLTIHGKILGRKLDGLTPAQLGNILANPPQKLSYAERHYSAAARNWSTYLVGAGFGASVAVCFSEADNRRDVFTNGLLLAETGLLTYGATFFTKSMAKKLRPYIYNDAAPISQKLRRDARQSFFSGHASSAAAMSFFAAKTWSVRHRGSSAAPWVWTAAATYPAVVGFLRMRGGKHYFRDVATGCLVGAAIGFGVPALHLKLGGK